MSFISSVPIFAWFVLAIPITINGWKWFGWDYGWQELLPQVLLDFCIASIYLIFVAINPGKYPLLVKVIFAIVMILYLFQYPPGGWADWLGALVVFGVLFFLFLPGSVWVKAEATAMEKDSDAVIPKVAEAPGVGLDELDFGVHALGHGVGDAMTAVREQPRQVTLEYARRLDHGRQPRVRCPEVPAIEELPG